MTIWPNHLKMGHAILTTPLLGVFIIHELGLCDTYVTEVHRCEQLAQSFYAGLLRVGFELTTC